MSSTIRWDLRLTALSSISHKDDESATTTALFRREKVLQPDGSDELVPIVSGNSFRGVLRRIGEELLRDVLEYEGQLTLAAAHLLRSGGAIHKVSGEALSGRRLEEVRRWVPQFAVFGGATSTIHKGCLSVGKVVPRIAEAAAVLADSTGPLRGQFEVLGLESYSRLDDAGDAAFPTVADAADTGGTALMRFEIETLVAGTEFESWVRLDRASDLQAAFFVSVLDAFAADGHLGGRRAIGHGRVAVDVTGPTVIAGSAPAPVDWRSELADNRDQVMAALGELGR